MQPRLISYPVDAVCHERCLHNYANDASRVQDADHAALTEDQRVIADGVQKAYSSGAIDTKDLQRIADKNGAPNGAQRFMSIMRLGASAKDIRTVLDARFCETKIEALNAGCGP